MQKRGLPVVRVSAQARWTLNALAGGYARKILKSNTLANDPVEGPHRVLMEGLESWAALMRMGMTERDKQIKYAHAADGRQYMTAMASGKPMVRELKG